MPKIMASPARRNAQALGSGMAVVRFDISLQHFFNFIYLIAKGFLTPREPENVYKNNRPGYAEGRKQIDTIVHYNFLPLFLREPDIHVFHDFVDFRDTHL
jgi:hypothetical protein